MVYMIWDQKYWWAEREDYSFGYLVPLFSLYVLYDRWPLIRNYLFTGTCDGSASDADRSNSLTRLCEWVAVVGFCGGISLFAVGALLRSVSGPQNPASLAIAMGFAGLVLTTVFLLSRETADGQALPLQNRILLVGLFLFPALIWLLSAPLVSVLETKIRVFLLTKVTIVVFNVFDLLGFALEREGNVLILPTGQVGVEEACSGIRSLTACLFAGSFLAAVFLNRLWKKVLLVAAAMCLAVFTNLLRSLFLTFWAYNYGSTAIDEHWVLPIFGDIGSVHDVTGFAILGLTCLGLICLLPIFNFQLRDFDESDAFDDFNDTQEETK